MSQARALCCSLWLSLALSVRKSQREYMWLSLALCCWLLSVALSLALSGTFSVTENLCGSLWLSVALCGSLSLWLTLALSLAMRADKNCMHCVPSRLRILISPGYKNLNLGDWQRCIQQSTRGEKQSTTPRLLSHTLAPLEYFC